MKLFVIQSNLRSLRVTRNYKKIIKSLYIIDSKVSFFHQYPSQSFSETYFENSFQSLTTVLFKTITIGS